MLLSALLLLLRRGREAQQALAGYSGALILMHNSSACWIACLPACLSEV